MRQTTGEKQTPMVEARSYRMISGSVFVDMLIVMLAGP